MVFGFGFNKTKVLASAERNVKQGKLQHAIVDYEKVLAEDPKDLTVMNTLGDLYARVGNIEKATEYFRKIGDAYATEGFTVRAIAMYKKLTKQNPGAIEAVQKLGDLYTQQGLHNDARNQYMQVAEHCLRNNDLQQAAAVFQKTLELDPENNSLQTRLAELYVKIGRAGDARDLYFRNAEALRARGALDMADDALGRVLSLDPNFAPAMLMRGIVKFDSGDPENAIHILEQLPDIDSRLDGSRTLLKAHLALGNLENAEPIARKLLQVHNDPTGIAGFGEALMAANSYEKALAIYVEHASVLLTLNSSSFLQTLQALTARVKTNAGALEQLLDIFRRAGNAGCIVEVTELLAHAYVQEGELAKARDFYQKLTQLEPENPQHAQNYRQIASKLADVAPPVEQHHDVQTQSSVESDFDDLGPTPSAPEESFPISQIEQKYPGDLGELIEAALTDAELFDSYNLPTKAIAPLEILLPRVSNDVRMNQRLASLYARSGRLKEAAERCDVLEQVHIAAGFLKDSRFYAELGAKYRQRAGLPPKSDTKTPAPPTAAPHIASPVQASTPEPMRMSAAAAATPASAPPRVVPPAPKPESHSYEIDLSSEWEEMCEVEEEQASVPEVPAAQAPASQPSVSAWDAVEEQESPLAELLDEVRFYVSQSMWPEARTALSRCAMINPTHPEVVQLQAQLASPQAGSTAPTSAVEFDSISQTAPSGQYETAKVDPLLMAATPDLEQATLPTVQASAVSQPQPATDLNSFVHDLEDSLGDFDLGPEPDQQRTTAPVTATPIVAQPPVQRTPVPAAVQTPPPAPAESEPAITEDEERSALHDIFSEFKESVEADSEAQEDPEMHYNLGIAFKEMDLFDEAIGEFQKVCQAIDRGFRFAQTVQTYTWLADCFLRKGIPDLAIRWFERALKSDRLDPETDTAIRYELASACETAGDRQAALKHFMEVYGTNIDYRDVAERIKTLRS